MSNFFAKLKNGDTVCLTPSRRVLSERAVELCLSCGADFSEIEYIDHPMHDFTISAGDEGYYLVSAGNTKLANREYGIGYFKERPDTDAVLKRMYMPVYGFKHNDLCRTVIVTGMPHDVAQLITVEHNEYRLAIRFMINGETPYEDIRLEVHDIIDESAGYSDMARIYREHQLANGFRPIRDRLTPELKYAAESPNIRVRMAWKPVPCKVVHQTPENEPPVHVACTFDDLISLMDDYRAAGIEKAELCLVGWNIKGHDGRWPQALPVESELGGEEGLRRMLAYAKKLGYRVCCHTNSTDAYEIADCFDENEMMVDKSGEIMKGAAHWSGGQTYLVCPRAAFETADRMLVPIAELGFRGVHYIDVITCVPAARCRSDKHPTNKKESCEYYDKLFLRAKELFGAVGSEGAYDHTLKNCDTVLYVSFLDYKKPRDARFAQHELSDTEIPFFQLVYHGIVLSNPYSRTVNAILSPDKDDLLKVIEYGGKPQMYYYAHFVDDGSDWIGRSDFHCHTDEERRFSAEKIKETLDKTDELTYLQYEFMEKHEKLSDGVYAVTYSDGSVVTVDYNNKTYTLCKG